VSGNLAGAAGVLDGIRVLDLCRDLSGPLTSMMLAENGADVIEVEHPVTGDETRSWPPMIAEGVSGYFAAVNRSKRGIAVNIKHGGGLAIIHELARTADVVMQSFTPGVADRLGVGYDAISEMNPGVVYYSLSGFGQTGPQRARRGYDPIMQAVSGHMSVMGEAGRGPVKSMVPVADLSAAIYGYGAITGALVARERDPQRLGQHIDLGMMDVMVSMLSVVAARFFFTDVIPERAGNENPQRVPSAAFECSDGIYLQAVPNQKQWPGFCRVLGHPEWADDPCYATPLARVRNQDTLYPLVRSVMLARPAAHWQEQLDLVGVACGPINNLEQVFADPQVRERELVSTYEIPGVGAVPGLRLPFRYSRSSCAIRRPPPSLGQHTREVMSELGHSDEEIDALAVGGVITVAAAERAPVSHDGR
jgi:crotonobetainyl-CoA:carnitine CoA-transferase CaiB-like acyl-CoA transferase